MNIADKIRFARREKDISQEQLAKLIGVSLPTISRWEGGQTDKISVEDVQNISKALEKSIEFFLSSHDDLEKQRRVYVSDLTQWAQKIDIYKLKSLVEVLR